MQTSERSMLLAVGSIARHQLTTKKAAWYLEELSMNTMVTTLLSAASAIIVAAPILDAGIRSAAAQEAVIPTSPPVGTFYGDFNHDGRFDLLFQDVDNRFWLSLSNGNGFDDKKEVLKHGGPFNPAGTHVADLNGMGAPTFSFQGVDNRFWLSLSNCDGTFHNTWNGDQENLKHGGPFNPTGAHIADFNGDGRADVLFEAWTTAFGYPFRTATVHPQYVEWGPGKSEARGSLRSSWRSHRGLQRRWSRRCSLSGRGRPLWLSLSNGDGTFHNTWNGDQKI